MQYSQYLQTKHWHNLRKEKIDSETQCKFCKSKGKLHLHHRYYTDNEGRSLLFNDEYAVIPLCPSCHASWHAVFGTKVYRRVRTKHFKRFRQLRHAGLTKRNAFIIMMNPEVWGIFKKKVYDLATHTECIKEEKCNNLPSIKEMIRLNEATGV